MRPRLVPWCTALAAAAALALTACSGSTTQADPTRTGSASAPGSPSGSATPAATAAAASSPSDAAVAATEATSSPDPASITWEPLEDPNSARKDYSESGRVPALTGASDEADTAFDAEIGRQIDAARAIARPAGTHRCSPACSLTVKKVSGTVRKGRFASVRADVFPYPGGVHPMGLVLATTIDLSTGDVLDLRDFVSATDADLLEAMRPTLVQHDVTDSDQVSLSDAAWTLTDDGITFSFPQGIIASEAAGIIDVHLPWKTVAPTTVPADRAVDLPAPRTATVSWTTIKRSPAKLNGYTEELRVPVLSGADKAVTQAFDAEVSRQVATLREAVKPTAAVSSGSCPAAPRLTSSAAAAAVYQGSYASAAGRLQGNGCQDMHSIPTVFDVTVDLRTGLLVDESTFVTAQAQAVTKAKQSALDKDGAAKAVGLTVDQASPAWSVGKEGITYVVSTGGEFVIDAEYTLPWSVLKD